MLQVFIILALMIINPGYFTSFFAARRGQADAGGFGSSGNGGFSGDPKDCKYPVLTREG
jgi:hypothetical protein